MAAKRTYLHVAALRYETYAINQIKSVEINHHKKFLSLIL
jgi:hypothetical protein